MNKVVAGCGLGLSAAFGLGWWTGGASADMARDAVAECAEALGEVEVVRSTKPEPCKEYSFNSREVFINGQQVEVEYTLPTADEFTRVELDKIYELPRRLAISIGSTIFLACIIATHRD